jgi:Zn-dependent protease
MSFNIVDVIFMIPALLTAVIFHEVAHGYVAYKLGDNTAKLEGRLTLNPIPHIDIFGSLLVPGLLILINSPFLFGWAKPVPINPYNFRKVNFKQGLVITSFAGPGANFLLAIIFSLLYWIFRNEEFLTFLASFVPSNLIEAIVVPLVIFFKYAVMTNLIIGIFNLLPIPPLDGGHILLNLLPNYIYEKVAPYEQYGFFVLILLLISGVLSKIIFPIYSYLISILIQ